ncbi:MAG TPA: isochorismatase family cysteine hydrolase [Bryobacteraceae bacterium]|nr:isochorismatase family cysteine hydrolase [Bryobacteraceae bacterium]
MNLVFVDVDTQLDFLYPGGALYGPGAEHLMPALTRLAEHARRNQIPVISTMDAHTESDPEFRDWPHHCVDGTLGQRKPQALLIDGGKQVFVKKQTLDPFRSPDMARALAELEADRYAVYGVFTEICVRHAVLGLAKAGKNVEVVVDAVRPIDDAKARAAFDEFAGAGVKTTRLDDLLAGSKRL